MPEICFFYGIKISMYWQDHNPPHFHAFYAGSKAEILINPLGIRSGSLPPKALSLVMEWASIHQQELLECWELAQHNQALPKLQPLV